MLNDFIIKSSLGQLQNLGYEVVDCSKLYFEGGELEGCVFKIKYNNVYFYSLSFPGGIFDFSFEKHVLYPIEYIVEKHLVVDNSNNNFEIFIEDQCFMRLYFEQNKTLEFNTLVALDLFKALAKKYNNKIEFLEDIDNINLNSVVKRS